MRRNFTDGMEITSGDLSKINPSLERELYDRVIFEMLQENTDGFFAAGFLVTRVSATQVQVAAGVGFQADASQVSPEAQHRMLYLPAATTANITSPDATNPRIDLVCVRNNRTNSATASRKFKAPTTGTITTETLVTETDWLADVLIVAGTPAGSPVAPAVPTGYLKIATLTVSALTGIAASGAVTDNRSILPVGPNLLLDTTGFSKLTAGVNTKLKTLLTDIDAGLASGGGGGGGLRWQSQTADGAVQDFENGEQVFYFPNGVAAKATVMMQVPNGYVAGKQISVLLTCYTTDATGNMKMKTVTTLIRQNTDAIDSVTNQYSSTNAQLTNTVAKAPRRITFDLTDSTGKVNAVSVSPGDILKIELTRDYGNETAAGASDVRFLPSATEPKLS